MTGTKERSFLFGTDAAACAEPGKRFGFYLWNFGILLLSAAGLCFLSLLLGIGTGGRVLLIDYLRHPLIFFLNFLPIFLFELLMFCLINRSWASFLATAVVFITASVGNYFKLEFRDDPFMFSDISAIHTALGVSSGYNITITRRIAICLICIVIGTLFMYFFVRGRAKGSFRIAAAIVIAASVWPLWTFVYSSADIYNVKTENFDHVSRWEATDVFTSKGFVHPFIHSISAAIDTPPDGYDENLAENELSAYFDSDIPESKKVNILAVQLEAFADLTTVGMQGIDGIYADYHTLEAESYTGNLMTNVFGGGTIDTERCFLTGYTQLKDYRRPVNSYVWYLREQGYTANGSHPCLRTFYNRYNVNRYLGFEDYLFTEGYYEKYGYPVTYDEEFFPDMLKFFKDDVADGKNVFSFNVTYQGHGPYSTDRLDWGDPVWDGDVSEYSYYVINNYLGSVKDTIERLCELKAELEAMDEPVVLVVYGDHKPWLGDNSVTYEELGINLDRSTTEGFKNYYSTRYLIWANDAAKEACDNDFIGSGPDISPCYLMNVLFSQLGWDGPAYMKFMNDAQSALPVINTSGFYFVDGEVTDSISGSLLDQKQTINKVQYYMRRNFKFSEVAS